MKKCVYTFAALLLLGVLFSACEKKCVCVTTRVTPTMNDKLETEMGRMTEKQCLEYNGTVADGEGVVRTIDCHLN